MMHAHVAASRPLPRFLSHPRWRLNPEDAHHDRHVFGSETSDAPHYHQGEGEILPTSHAVEAEALRESRSTDQAEQFAIRFGLRGKDLQKEFTDTKARGYGDVTIADDTWTAMQMSVL
jgi:hypothetical protein